MALFLNKPAYKSSLLQQVPTPKVYIVIVNYKQWEDSRDCLASVLKSTYTNFSVIIIDNASGNNSLERLKDWFENIPVKRSLRCILLSKSDVNKLAKVSALPEVIFIQNDTNAGFAAGNNVALSLLQGEDAYFWLLNPDMIIREDTLEEMARFAIEESTNAIIGAVIKSFSGNHELLFYGGATINFMTATITMTKEISTVPRLDYISGACLFAHTSNLKRIGLLPEKYFLYWEETDWCYRANQLGCRFHVCPTAICYDKISTVIGKSFMADYFYVRNGLLFISEYRKKNLPFVLFFNIIRFFKRVFTGQWKRANGVFRGTIDFFKIRSDETK